MYSTNNNSVKIYQKPTGISLHTMDVPGVAVVWLGLALLGLIMVGEWASF